MKILDLELVGYKRFVLNNVHKFVIAPRKPIQLIIGTNGSGKSSLLQELSPLPALSSDFVTDGYKKIRLEHRGSVYELTNTFKSKQEHSFIKDGISLNLQGTASVQKDLVKQEFFITQEVQFLISGQVSFCSMSSSDRRYWFTKLADTNYDYALALYKRLNEKLRDVNGSLKIAKNRLVAETAKIVTNEEKLILANEVEDLHKVLQLLIEYRIPLEKNPSQCEAISKQIQDKIINFYNQLIKKKNNHKSRGLTIEQIDLEIKNLESDKTVQELLIASYFEKHSKLSETIDLLKQTGGKDSDQFRQKIDDVNSEISLKEKNKLLELGFTDIHNAVIAFETVEDSLMEVFTSLPVNLEGKYSKSRLIYLSSLILTLKDKDKRITNELSRLETIKTHHEAHRNQELTECPSCSFKWFKGFVQSEYDAVSNKIEHVRDLIDEVSTELQNATIEHQEIIEYSETYKIFSSCIGRWPILQPVWDYVLSEKILTDNPRGGVNLINKIKFDFKIDLELNILSNENLKTKEFLAITESIGKADITKLIVQCEELETGMQICTLKSQNVSAELKGFLLYKKDMLDIMDLAEQIDILMSAFSLNYTEHKEAFRRDALFDVIRAVQNRLSKKEQLLSELNIQASIIADIQKQVDMQQLEETAYRAIVKELSPVEGLIAEGLLGFISSFVFDMNEFISKVWLYPLEVIACGLDEDGGLELDYKFPLKIQNNLDNIPDVNKGSSAMKEIVDLAFRITAIKYLGLDDSPLLLDEFGKTFDKEHRLAAAYGIKELMEMKSFTQLFTVSHYEATYGSLTNAEICVLCSKNISIPTNAVYNEHVMID